MKIVLIGAGSRSFARGQVVDLLSSEALTNSGLELILVDENPDALDTMHAFAQRVRNHVGCEVSLSATTERQAALPGADFVIVAVERKRMELWEQDFRIPIAYGFRHILGENGGPGALFHALRTIDLLVPIANDISHLCPEAWLFNFTNPEMRILHAVSHLTRAKAVGFCHGVFSALDLLSRYLDSPVDELDVASAGINHFYAVTKCRDVTTGKDLLPRAIQCAIEDESAPELFRTFARVFNVFTFPSDDHIGEYFAWGTTYDPMKWAFGIEARPIPKSSHAEPSLEDWASGTAPLDERALQCSGESTVPAIEAIALNRQSRFPAVNVINHEGYIDNLPRSAAVEVPATIDGQGIHPESVGIIPEPFAALLRTQISIAECVTEAYRLGSRKMLLQALLMDPVITDARAAEVMLNDMLTTQSEWLPAFE